MKQTNIKISKYVRDKLSEINGGTFDAKVNTLVDIVGPLMPFVEYSNERTNIKTNTKTLERLDTFRITSTESRDSILTRMLIMLDELNNASSEVEEWIPFKLTNPYNDLLVIDGQIEFNSKELSFNYRGNIYREKLPRSYVADGKDLTKELYKWYDNLDWTRISNLLIENVDNQTVIDERDFILEINDVFKSEV